MNQINTPLTDTEIEELSQFLTKSFIDNDGMELEEVHGFITGLICGPDTIPPSLWMEEIFNGPPQFESEEQENKIFNYLCRLYHQTFSCIKEEEFFPATCYPIHPERSQKNPDYMAIKAWCEGFIRGISSDHWEDIPTYQLLSFPFLVMTAPDNHPLLNDLAKDRKQSIKKVRQHFLELITPTIHEIFKYMQCIKFWPFPDFFKEAPAEHHECSDENCQTVH